MSDDGTQSFGFKPGQKQAITDAMIGNNIAMLAGVGFGKTLIASGVALARALRGETNMDLIVANSQEYNKYLSGILNPGQANEIKVSDFIQLANQNGGKVNIYDMDRLAQNAQQLIAKHAVAC